MLEGLLLHTIAFPHIFGFLPILVGALGAALLPGAATMAVVGTGAMAGAMYMGTEKAAKAARDQANAANDAATRAYWYNTENWNLTKERLIADHEFLTEQAKIKAANEQTRANFADATNAQQYHYNLQIRNARQESNLKQYAKSEEVFGSQISLNAVEAEAAKHNEMRALQEAHAEAAFEADDAYLENLSREGTLRSRGIKGRSIGKATQATLADYGRQMSLISESLSSAGRNTRAVLKEIQRSRFSADLAAYAQKMLEPGVEPMPIIPYATPVAQYQLPRALTEADFGAKPVMGATYNPNAASAAVWGNAISSIAGIGLSAMPWESIGQTIAGGLKSDIGLKENLEYIEKSPSGINIYEWNYIGDNQRYRGVIAQDLIAQGKYDAVSEGDNGYLAVDYSQLDVQMTAV